MQAKEKPNCNECSDYIESCDSFVECAHCGAFLHQECASLINKEYLCENCHGD